jgi:hypothetical protein
MIKVSAIALSAILAITSVANAAGTRVNSNTSSRSVSGSTSVAKGGSSKNTITNVVGGNGTNGFNGLQAPGVVGPSVSSASTDTCLGSISFGASGPGGGLSFGTTTEDRPCNARKDALLLNALGLKKAAREALCTDPAMYATLAAAGIRCRINPQLVQTETVHQTTPSFTLPFGLHAGAR